MSSYGTEPARDNGTTGNASAATLDYLTRDDLLLLGLSEDEADAVLSRSPLTGHDGRRVVEADRVDDLLGLVAREEDEEGPA
jgi:hypothetical protein